MLGRCLRTWLGRPTGLGLFYLPERLLLGKGKERCRKLVLALVSRSVKWINQACPSSYATLARGPVETPCKENEGRNYEKEKEMGATQKKD